MIRNDINDQRRLDFEDFLLTVVSTKKNRNFLEKLRFSKKSSHFIKKILLRHSVSYTEEKKQKKAKSSDHEGRSGVPGRARKEAEGRHHA